MGGFLTILGFLVFIVGIYIGSYVLNKNTAVPEGIEPATCSSCNSNTCSVKVEKSNIVPDDCELEILN